MSALNAALQDPSMDNRGILKVYSTAAANFDAATKSVTEPMAKSAADAVSRDLHRLASARAEVVAASEAGKSAQIIDAITATKSLPAATSFQHDWDVKVNGLCSGYDD